MKRTSFRTVAAPATAALVLGMALTGCAAGNEKSADASSSDGPKLSGTLNGAGSSAQEAAQGAWTAGFQSTNSGATVNYDPVGSSGGREQFLSGGVDFAGSDSALTTDELASSKKTCNGETALEVPAYISPVALVYNLDGVDKLQLSAKTAADIFNGKIKTWDDAAIKAENPDAKLPSDRIVPVHRSDGSGTTDNLTQWLSKAGEGAWTSEPGGDWPLKGGEGAEGTSGVIEAVKSGKGTIGYADHSQAGDLSVASIKVGDAYVAPSAEGATKVVDLSPKADRSRRQRHGHRHRPHHDGVRRLPADARVLRDRLPDLRRQEQGGPGQGLPHVPARHRRPGRRCQDGRLGAAAQQAGWGRGRHRRQDHRQVTSRIGCCLTVGPVGVR